MSSETEVEKARRQVREGEMDIARQREVLLGLDAGSPIAGVAQQLLCCLEEMLASDVEHLEELMAADAAASRPRPRTGGPDR